MKAFKHILSSIIVVVLAMFVLALNEGMAETPIFKDYQVIEVQPFEVPLNVAAPASAGRDLAYEIVYQIMRYSDKFNIFDMVIMEGTQQIPPDKKVLLVTGAITAYNPKGTCAVNCQFVDKSSGQVLHETKASSFTFRVANYIARVIYNYKVGGK
jgi:hypothetical protein